jgi:hypothetical protein
MDSLGLAEHNCRYAHCGPGVPAQNKEIFSQRQRKQTRPALLKQLQQSIADELKVNHQLMNHRRRRRAGGGKFTSGDAVLEPNRNHSNAALTRIHSRVKRVGVQSKSFNLWYR